MCFILLTRTESLSQLLLPCQYALLVITIPAYKQVAVDAVLLVAVEAVKQVAVDAVQLVAVEAVK